MADWFDEFFVAPMREPSAYAPYNWLNTLAYAAVALVAAYALYRLLKRYKVGIDDSLFKTVLPFVIFGSALRVVQDAGILPRQVVIANFAIYPFVTPSIYFVTFLALAACFITFRKERAKAQLAGWTAALVCLALLFPLFKNWWHALAVFGLALAAKKAFEIIWDKRGLRRSLVEEALVFGQVLDGAASFVAIQFPPAGTSYFEQHVVGGALMGAFTPFAFFLLKVLFAFAVVELLRREKTDATRYVMMLIAVFGLAPGLRDCLRVLAGV